MNREDDILIVGCYNCLLYQVFFFFLFFSRYLFYKTNSFLHCFWLRLFVL